MLTLYDEAQHCRLAVAYVVDFRVVALVDQMDAEGFGSCTNHGECEAACPKEIPIAFIARLNRDYLRANIKPRV